MAFTPITLTASFTRPDGSPARGRVSAILSEPIANGVQEIEPAPIYGILNTAGQLKDASGTKPLVLEANDDPATLPPGSSYQFTIELDGAAADTFSAVVPHAAPGGTIDLSAL